jgi:hypothetical protein
MDILDEFETYKKSQLEPKKELSPATKKLLTIIFFVSLVMFAKYAPYGNETFQADSLGKTIFMLYFFIINQTLGIVHEGGHGVCYILHCPEFIMVAMGTVFQLLFPFLVGYYYKRQGKVFIYLMGLFVLGISLHYTAWYMSTAHEGLLLPAHKSFLGVDAMHDWNRMFSSFGLVKYDWLLAGITRFIAYGVMIYSVGYMFLLAFFGSKKNKGHF